VCAHPDESVDRYARVVVGESGVPQFKILVMKVSEGCLDAKKDGRILFELIVVDSTALSDVVAYRDETFFVLIVVVATQIEEWSTFAYADGVGYIGVSDSYIPDVARSIDTSRCAGGLFEVQSLREYVEVKHFFCKGTKEASDDKQQKRVNELSPKK
jgi:hypothetical protein